MLAGRPPPRLGREGLAIVAIMRDEARHIEDWLMFHGLAGVQDFFLYDDGSTDGTPELARVIAGLNVTVIPWKMTASLRSPEVFFSRQVLAYCHAIENFGGAFRWMAFIDIDEYIIPKRTGTILEVLDNLNRFTNVSLPWTMYGPNGHKVSPDLPAPYAYTTRAARREGPLLNFKCIVDPTDVTEVRVHRFRTLSMGKESVNDIGYASHYKSRHRGTFISDAALQLNHYYTRSHAELSLKLSKGAVSDSALDRRAEKVREKLALIEETAIEDRSAISFLERNGVTKVGHLRSLKTQSSLGNKHI